MSLQRRAGNRATVRAVTAAAEMRAVTTVQRTDGEVTGPDPGAFAIGDRVTVLKTSDGFHEVGRLRDDKVGWIRATSVALDQRGSADPAVVGELLNKLAAAVRFIPQANVWAFEKLVAGAKEPGNLAELESFSDVANKVYALFDHRIAEQEQAESPTTPGGIDPVDSSQLDNAKKAKEDVTNYRAELLSWTGGLQSTIYGLRDTLLAEDPDQLSRFSLTSQYKKTFPDKPVPDVLEQVDATLGTVVFSGNVENDCGRFAKLLLLERARQAMNQYMATREGESGGFTPEDFQELVGMPGAKDVTMATLTYKEDSLLPYPHHVKTSVGGDRGEVFALEANKGKPFLLAPELQVYAGQKEFLEEGEPSIESRTETSLERRLGVLLGPKTPGVSSQARLEVVKDEQKSLLAEPLGKRTADYRESKATATGQGAPLTQKEKEWNATLGMSGIEEAEDQRRCLSALRVWDERTPDLDERDVIGEWVDEPTSFEPKFSAEKFKKWLENNGVAV